MGPLSVPTLQKDKKSKSEPICVCGSNCSSRGDGDSPGPSGHIWTGAHSGAVTIHTREECDSVSEEEKKKVLKWALLWAWVSLCNFIRVYEDQSKQYEDTEHAHSPALSVHKPINFQDMQRPWGKWVCWSDEPPFPGNSPTKTISLSLAMPPALQRAQFLL